ncbi:MAG: acyltransferase [Terricaulis sp.]
MAPHALSDKRRAATSPCAAPKHIVGLDLVRFAAAFGVMLFHYFSWSWLVPTSTGARVLHGAAAFSDAVVGRTWFGWVGVEVFFVISGFVIAFSAEGVSAASFARARVLRLAPAAWICASLTSVVALMISFDWRPVLAADFLRSVLFSPIGPYIDGVYWTLGIEISFYVLVFILLLVSRFRYIEGLAFVIGAVSLAFLFATRLAPVFVHDLAERLTELSLLRHGVFFAMGVTIWACVRHGFTPWRLGFFVLMMIGAWREIDLTALTFLADMQLLKGVLAPQLLFSAAVLMIVTSVFANRAFAGSWLVAPLRTLGFATYPLYLFHQLVGTEFMKLLIGAGLPSMAAAWTTIAACVLFAILIATAIEPPIRNALRNALLFAEAKLGPTPSRV